MTKDQRDDDNVLIYGIPTGTVSLEIHPEDIIDVDPHVLAVTRARLRGESLADVYVSDERVSPAFLLRQEARKLQRVFGSESQLREAFSSVTNIAMVHRELEAESVDKSFLAAYSKKLAQGENVDEIDAYSAVAFATPIRTKHQRLTQCNEAWAELVNHDSSAWDGIVSNYVMSHFAPMSVPREMVRLPGTLRTMMQEGKLVSVVNEILRRFYLEAA